MTDRNIWVGKHHRGDTYLPLCYYPQGSLEDLHWEIVWRGVGAETRALAWQRGLKALGHDDFNIAVLRDGRCVAWLWNDEVVDMDPGFLDEITAELIEAIGG